MSGSFRKPIVPRGLFWLVNIVGCAAVAGGQPLSEFPVPTATSSPYGIPAGPDGNVWFTESYGVNGLKIGRITPSGAITEYPLPASQGALAITAGPDGAL